MQIHQRAQWSKGKENFFSLWNLFENCLKINHVNANGFKHVVQITWNQPKKQFLVIPIKFFLFSRYNRHCAAHALAIMVIWLYSYVIHGVFGELRVCGFGSISLPLTKINFYHNVLKKKQKTIRNLSVIVFLENCKTVIQLPSSLLLWVVVTEPSF